ncbi:Pyruvate dehydrogenase phosphatase regulatory subunit, mitochondrial [Folsomia candida]|uniref:Pyruvate dehydrogenase phosphatase regulatory subunit, mitochondrial n=1 Tax=Folsomia candida TaxID=158441 RepID=A0A226F4N0_FOLCA|nr:Pyruvate dehydrogenase phosphatase regulatory subunit, mitochondrial [Folsomia candida]
MNSFRLLLSPLASHARLCRRFSQTQMTDILPKEARVVICGSGIVGNSVAYHLVQKGWTDVVVIDQEDGIGKGTSIYGSGVLALLKPVEEQQIINKSIALYKKLQADGHEIGLQECGSMYLAQNRERMVLFRRRAALNQPQGIDCKIIGPREIADIHPLVNTSDLQGGIYVAADVVAHPVLLCHVLAELAHSGGVRFVGNCQFLNLSTRQGRVSAVETSLGTIKCEYFVNCAGMWSWELGQKCNPKVRIPVHPAEHYYLLTESLNKPLPGVLPTIRDYDSGIYIRKLENNSFLMGGFEKVAKPVFTKGIPKNWKDCLSSDWDHFAPLLDRCLHRAPVLRECELKFLRNAPDNFTPDGKWILGEAPEIDNYFVAAGMNGNSLQGAGGIGHSLAHWITEGAADICLLDFDVRRFIDVHNNRRFLYERVKEVVGRQYAILFPFQTDYKSARKIRCSPLYSTLRNKGAVFGNIMSFERSLYFDLEHEVGKDSEMPPGTYWKPHFFENLKEEYKNCREGVGVIDMSSFSKFQITSPKEEVVAFLQKLCANDIDIPVGHVSPSGMHNEQGGYENDCMLIREQPNCYFMVAPTKQQTRIAEWMDRHLPQNGYVQINDVTSMYTVLLIIGPKSREVLSQLVDDDVDLKMLPFTYQMVSLGHSPKTIKVFDYFPYRNCWILLR